VTATKVLLVDDQAMVRRGFRMIVDSEQDMTVIAEAGDGAAAVQAAARFRPDVVLMDIRMPRLDGLAAMAEILRAPQAPRVLVLTTFDLDEYLYDALRIGASGFLLKNATPETLVEAIRVAARGDALLDPSVTRRVIERIARAAPPDAGDAAGLAELTPREAEVLDLVARGCSNAEIADRLVLSGSTVKSHVASILLKLGLRDRIQVVVFAYEHGLVRPGRAAS